MVRSCGFELPYEVGNFLVKGEPGKFLGAIHSKGRCFTLWELKGYSVKTSRGVY